MRISTLALAIFSAFAVASTEGAASEENVFKILPVSVIGSASFSGAELGLELVNGVPTEAEVSFQNQGSDAVRLVGLSGTLHKLGSTAILRNLTRLALSVEIGPGESTSVPFRFVDELMPQEVNLALYGTVEGNDGELIRIPVYHGLANIVEAPVSFLDPQMLFLYAFLSVVFSGVMYFVYNTWVSSLLPRQPKKTARKPTVPLMEKKSITKATSPDENWIPIEHLRQRGSEKNAGKGQGLKARKVPNA